VLNKKETNSILNINISNLTSANGPPTYTSNSNNGYNCNKNFFDNSVMNKLNQDNTIITSNKNNYENVNNKNSDNLDQEKNYKKTLNKKNKDASDFTFVNENDFNSEKKLEINIQGKLILYLFKYYRG
jgi:hypothetical protein